MLSFGIWLRWPLCNTFKSYREVAMPYYQRQSISITSLLTIPHIFWSFNTHIFGMATAHTFYRSRIPPPPRLPKGRAAAAYGHFHHKLKKLRLRSFQFCQISLAASCIISIQSHSSLTTSSRIDYYLRAILQFAS